MTSQHRSSIDDKRQKFQLHLDALQQSQLSEERRFFVMRKDINMPMLAVSDDYVDIIERLVRRFEIIAAIAVFDNGKTTHLQFGEYLSDVAFSKLERRAIKKVKRPGRLSWRRMHIYLISQPDSDWDTYDSAVVVAESEDAARQMHPDGSVWSTGAWISTDPLDINHARTWIDPGLVRVQMIGLAVDGITGVICASFRHG